MTLLTITDGVIGIILIIVMIMGWIWKKDIAKVLKEQKRKRKIKNIVKSHERLKKMAAQGKITKDLLRYIEQDILKKE